VYARIDDVPPDVLARVQAELERYARGRLPVTAHHEAGHAVASVVLGLQFESVDIQPRAFGGAEGFNPRSDSLGRLWRTPKPAGWYYDRRRGRERAEAAIVSVLAGPTAEYRLRGLVGPVRLRRWSSDWESVCEMAESQRDSWRLVDAFYRQIDRLEARGLDSDVAYRVAESRRRAVYLRPLRARARELVERHWPEIEAVAEALMRRGSLTGRGVQRIVRAVSSTAKLPCP
jgi:hypothetical protein